MKKIFAKRTLTGDCFSCHCRGKEVKDEFFLCASGTCDVLRLPLGTDSFVCFLKFSMPRINKNAWKEVLILKLTHYMFYYNAGMTLMFSPSASKWIQNNIKPFTEGEKRSIWVNVLDYK